jgi:dUTPase
MVEGEAPEDKEEEEKPQEAKTKKRGKNGFGSTDNK